MDNVDFGQERIADSDFFLVLYTKNYVDDDMAKSQLDYARFLGKPIYILKEAGVDIDMSLFDGAAVEGVAEFTDKTDIERALETLMKSLDRKGINDGT